MSYFKHYLRTGTDGSSEVESANYKTDSSITIGRVGYQTIKAEYIYIYVSPHEGFDRL